MPIVPLSDYTDFDRFRDLEALKAAAVVFKTEIHLGNLPMFIQLTHSRHFQVLIVIHVTVRMCYQLSLSK